MKTRRRVNRRMTVFEDLKREDKMEDREDKEDETSTPKGANFY